MKRGQKILVAVLFYISYALLFGFSWFVIVAAAMNRGASSLGSFGFYLFLALLITSPMLFTLLIKKDKFKWLLVAGSIPLVIYACLFGFHIATNFVYI
jgi:hypothetical protein